MNMKQMESNLEEKISNASVITDEQYMELKNPRHVATGVVHDDGSYYEYWLLSNGDVVKTERFLTNEEQRRFLDENDIHEFDTNS